MKTLQFTIKVRSGLLPSDALWYITRKIKDALPVVSIECEELHDRPTSTEHHGGNTE